MTPIAPHLITALLAWICKNEKTPYLLVNTTVDAVAVPEHLIKDGHIILDISPSAIEHWVIDDEAVSFSARFSGEPYDIYVPIDAVKSVYAKETGQGMVFTPENGEMDPPPEKKPAPKKPKLTVVK